LIKSLCPISKLKITFAVVGSALIIAMTILPLLEIIPGVKFISIAIRGLLMLVGG